MRNQAQEESRKAVQGATRKTASNRLRPRESAWNPRNQRQHTKRTISRRLGVIVEDKEDDKSGPTEKTLTIVANQPLAAGGYETKEAREARKGHEDQARQRDKSGRAQQRQARE